MTDWTERARRLADELTTAGVLAPQWRPAFEEVPRHAFVPRFYADDSIVDGADPAQQDGWLDAVYRDESLVTQLTQVPGQALMWPTSSSTKPSLMARMLGLLNVSTGHSVMEIGTGTGYNAALLSHRLGDQQVASVDIDPALVDAARVRLAGLGYHPHLIAGDGAAGIADRAPYDRIIAACAVPAIPAAWVAQLNERGVIVADVRSELSSALVVLVKTSPNTVQGRFLSVPGHFMWLRAQVGNPLRDGGELSTNTDLTGADTSFTDDDQALLNDPELRFMLTLCVPDFDSIWSIEREGEHVQALRFSDGSWAELAQKVGENGRYRIVQGGPRRVWDKVHDVITVWESYGRPERSRFGMTVSANGTQDFWLDTPTRVINTMTALRRS